MVLSEFGYYTSLPMLKASSQLVDLRLVHPITEGQLSHGGSDLINRQAAWWHHCWEMVGAEGRESGLTEPCSGRINLVPHPCLSLCVLLDHPYTSNITLSAFITTIWSFKTLSPKRKNKSFPLLIFLLLGILIAVTYMCWIGNRNVWLWDRTATSSLKS